MGSHLAFEFSLERGLRRINGFEIRTGNIQRIQLNFWLLFIPLTRQEEKQFLKKILIYFGLQNGTRKLPPAQLHEESAQLILVWMQFQKPQMLYLK